MELTQLNQFRIVAETGNIVDASNILNISQPALTKSIKNLENELNATLFDRTNHKLVLNEYGKMVLSFVNDIFSTLNDMKTDLKFQRTNQETISICSSINAIVSFVTPKLNIAFPSVQFYHQFRNIQRFKTYIEDEIFDLAISSSKIISPHVENQTFIKDFVLISVPETSPLFHKDTLKLSDLNGLTFVNISTTINNPLPALFENLLLTQGIHINQLYTTDQLSLITLLKTSNLFAYTSSVGANSNTLSYGLHRKYIPIDCLEHAYLTYYLSYRRDKAQQLQKYIDWFLDQAIEFNSYSERRV